MSHFEIRLEPPGGAPHRCPDCNAQLKPFAAVLGDTPHDKRLAHAATCGDCCVIYASDELAPFITP